MNRRYDDALQALQKVEADAHSDFGLELLAGTYARLGRSNEAKAVIAAILKRLPNQSIEGLRAIYAYHMRCARPACRSGPMALRAVRRTA